MLSTHEMHRTRSTAVAFATALITVSFSASCGVLLGDDLGPAPAGDDASTDSEATTVADSNRDAEREADSVIADGGIDAETSDCVYAPGNLFDNPSFEFWDGSWPRGWNSIPDCLAKPTAPLHCAIAVELTCPTFDTTPAGTGIGQQVILKPLLGAGERLTVIVHAKDISNDNVAPTMRLHVFDVANPGNWIRLTPMPESKFPGWVTGDGKWHEAKIEFTNNTGAMIEKIDLWVIAHADKTIAVDDAVLLRNP
jgi:hypothetical protein